MKIECSRWDGPLPPPGVKPTTPDYNHCLTVKLTADEAKQLAHTIGKMSTSGLITLTAGRMPRTDPAFKLTDNFFQALFDTLYEPVPK